MAKRYVYKILYKGNLIEKIDIVADDRDIAEDDARSQALDSLDVILEDVIEEG